MPIPGYDPDDVDRLLEDKLTEAQAQDLLSEENLASWQDGDASLAELLDEDEIDRLLQEHGA